MGPLWLSPFILIIETISNLVRPITLRVRLIANIGAGHIIIHLISIGCVFSSLSFIISLYILFEVLISLIQSLIFFTLLILYLREQKKKKKKKKKKVLALIPLL